MVHEVLGVLFALAVWCGGFAVVAACVRGSWLRVHGPELPARAATLLLASSLSIVPLVLGDTDALGPLGWPFGTVIVCALLLRILWAFVRDLVPSGLPEATEPADLVEDLAGYSFTIASRSPYVPAVLLGLAAGTCGLGGVLVLLWGLVPSRARRVRIRPGQLAVDGSPPVALRGAAIDVDVRWDGQAVVRVRPREGQPIALPMGRATDGEVRWVRRALAVARRAKPPEPIPDPPDALRAVRERVRE